MALRRHAPVMPVTITADEYNQAMLDAAQRHKDYLSDILVTLERMEEILFDMRNNQERKMS